ncbi:Gfo/Idh/MocA family oxidoreductase [Frankia sp. CNm7]|uniref:Gfo/Idh/MocA family oxidoreductase n=1 Tax=Frankia nepalensis TaxID=1836974 RepID=A0A937RPE3_9ACTN|nr:Gfo/Idh/MocA family oxidoreductase [Frankia nepalensis]MBL7501498.1 Gfo/Idh/MocA family oxidoreductase [Frankia nepalensis]MBL7513626.1 Gfo/Idh/MocA family oxidoreductase [Frankia nepalensis]MBL7523847.1 Gfo/Idh/MocA family oxidoreductase [Frankia nepalensis]MBL7633757.1 Gfo/Idh/MocA family oxidoreductase [Frankia nepalensis]
MSFRWAIAGTGEIARGFAVALNRLPDAELVAVGSHDPAAAEDFGEWCGVPRGRRHGSYGELAADDGVDIVYVATPSSHHHRHTSMFLRAGRGVLCEKPFGLDAAQASEMVAAARAQGRFLMEAMSSRFLPTYVHLRELVAAGSIGTVLGVDGELGLRFPSLVGHRLFDHAQGDGALLDLGVYPVSLASMLLGEPDRVSALGQQGPTGADEHVAVLMNYRHGAMALTRASLRVSLGCIARIFGTDGSIELPAFMHCPDELLLRGRPGTQRLHLPAASDNAHRGHLGSSGPGGGLHHQIRHVHERLRAGQLDSDVMPLAESVSVMRTLDVARAHIALRYLDADLRPPHTGAAAGM